MSNADKTGSQVKQGAEPRNWLTMTATDFNDDLPLVQGALFAEPDRLGTPAMFGDAFGIDAL